MEELTRLVGRLANFNTEEIAVFTAVSIAILAIFLIALGVLFLQGTRLFRTGGLPEKSFLVIAMVGACLVSIKQPEALIFLITGLIIFLGFLWEAGKKRRGERKLLKSRNDNHKKQVELAKANQQQVIVERDKTKSSWKSMLIQTVSMVAVFTFTKIVLGHGTTEASGAGLLSAAILGVIFRGES
jgi:hypothetical protein